MNHHTLGIIGGGQLGKMLLQYCSRLNIKTHVYDKNRDSPCRNLCEKFSVGDFQDYSKIVSFGRQCTIVTYEIENINIEALKVLESEGVLVYPRPNTLEIIQNKNVQKCYFEDNDFPTTKFKRFNTLSDIRTAIESNSISIPCVWKKTTAGYDGFGVKIISNILDVNSLIEGECIIEEYVPIEKELSVIVARNSKGDFKSYPPVEMLFNGVTNQIEYVIAPANISEQTHRKAMDIAHAVSSRLRHIGLLAVELFVTKDGQVLINELAPRPHNSGHLTIEHCCPTSQFEQHIRSIFNLPLGNTEFTEPAIMLNLVPDKTKDGSPVYHGIEYAFQQKNTYVHLYGKCESRVHRKMGHITIVGGEHLFNTARKIRKNIRIS